jgi:hypothetical protein
MRIRNYNLEVLKYTQILQKQSGHYDVSKLTPLTVIISVNVMSASLSEGFNSALNYVIQNTLIIATHIPRTFSYLRPAISSHSFRHTARQP